VSVTTLQAPITAHTAAEYAKEELLVRQCRGLTAVDRLVSLSDGHIRVPCGPGPRSLQQSPAGSELLRISLSLVSNEHPSEVSTNAYAFPMARRVVTLLEDDFDGSTASETISFAVDGVEYAIDLNDVHAHELREVFSRYTKAARRIGGRPQSARPRSSKAQEVRLWAVGQGLNVNNRGRIQADIMKKYEAAH
jgi:hypothetical protein